MSNKSKNFAENFKALMKEKNLSQAKLAVVLSVDQTTISAWLRRESEPTLSKIIEILEFFEVSFDELID